MTSSFSRVSALADRAPGWALGIAAIVTAIALHAMPLSHDVVWQFWIARQLQHGARLYVDIWEVNPPLWFWSAMPVRTLAAALHVPPLHLLVVLVVGWGALSAWLVERLGGFSGAPRRLVILLVTFWLMVIGPLSDFAQREHLALICAIPYAALIARRAAASSGQEAPCAALAVLIGAMAAYGFALKHYFVSIPVLLELWLLLRDRRQWRLLRPETMVLALCALAYAACVVAITPAFLTTMLPMLKLAYHGYESAWIKVLVAPWTLIWALIAAWFALYGRVGAKRGDPLVATLLLTALGFAFAYVVQAKAWAYHALPVTGALALALGFALDGKGPWRAMPRLLGLAMLGLAMAVPFFTGPYLNFLRPESDSTLASVPAGEPVQVLAADPMWAWPGVEEDHLRWPSRLYAYWMVPAIALAEESGSMSPAMHALSARILDEAALDMRCAPPAVVLIERQPRYNSQPAAFDERAFFLRKPEIRAFLAEHYLETQPTPSLYVYRRRHPVTPMIDPACPSVF